VTASQSDHGLGDLFADADYRTPPQRVRWSGNPNLPGCPLYEGWMFKLHGRTTPEQRKILRARGWSFSGGKWGKRDPDPCGFGAPLAQCDLDLGEWEKLLAWHRREVPRAIDASLLDWARSRGFATFSGLTEAGLAEARRVTDQPKEAALLPLPEDGGA